MSDTQRFAPLRKQFEANGFVHLPAFLAAEEVNELRDQLERYKRDVVPSLKPFRALYDVDGEENALKHLVDMDKADVWFAGILHGAKATKLAAVLLGEEVAPQSLAYFDKAPRIGKATPAHQDGYYFVLKPNHALTLWIALDDCDQENGCIYYVPGSHRRGVIDHNPSGVVGFSQGLSDKQWQGAELWQAAGSAGDCFAHHSLTIHLAGPNRSQRHRQSLGLTYYGVSARRDEESHARYQASLNAQRQQYATGATK